MTTKTNGPIPELATWPSVFDVWTDETHVDIIIDGKQYHAIMERGPDRTENCGAFYPLDIPVMCAMRAGHHGDHIGASAEFMALKQFTIIALEATE